MYSITKIITILASVSLAALAHAGPGDWTINLKGGVVNAVGGDVHRGPSFDGSVLLGLDPGNLPVNVDAKSFDDVYGDFTELALEFGYQSTERLSYFAGLSQMQSDEGVLRVGTVADSLPLNGRFSDYNDLGLYGGIAYRFTNSSKWTPRVAAQAGYKEVDAITASFSVPDVTFVDPYQGALTNAPFYDDSNVWSLGLIVGLDYRATENLTFGLETGYFSQSSLDGNDSVLDVLGLGALNDEGDLEYMPIRLTASFRF